MKPVLVLISALAITLTSLAPRCLPPAADRPPVTLLPGIGSLHHPIATNSTEAQRFFDQGLTLDYGFNHDEAERSFRRAAELDPQSPMPQWGVALALGTNYNSAVDEDREKRAYEAVQKGLALAPSAPESERAYLEALAKRYSNDAKPDFKKLDTAYVAAMRELSSRYPDDLDAATLYAESMMDLHPWHLWDKDGKPAENTGEIIGVLESVLRRNPNHIGAIHFYIHALEPSPYPERALAAAHRLGALAPGVGHLVHMPSHIYFRTGDFESAAASNAAAAEVDRAFFHTAGDAGLYPRTYYSHNLHCIAFANSERGRFEDAKRAAGQLFENVVPHVKEVPMVEHFIYVQTYVLLRFHRWQGILSSPAPDASLHLATAVWHFARGMAFAATGDLASALVEQKAFAAAREESAAHHSGRHSDAAAILDVAAAELDAQNASARGDRKAAIEGWKKAVVAQDALDYSEPPDWYYSVRQSLGAALLRDGQAAEAEKVFRAELAKNPRNGRALFGLCESLKAQKKATDAVWVQREFETAWKDADGPLTLADL